MLSEAGFFGCDQVEDGYLLKLTEITHCIQVEDCFMEVNFGVNTQIFIWSCAHKKLVANSYYQFQISIDQSIFF
jgi:hypothetical protein